MSDTTLRGGLAPNQDSSPTTDGKPHVAGAAFFIVLIASFGFTAYNVLPDMSQAGGVTLATGAFVLLGMALLIAQGFEFVNGFHDTANAVATVIYTHGLSPMFAVIWSGCFKFLGVPLSTGAIVYRLMCC